MDDLLTAVGTTRLKPTVALEQSPTTPDPAEDLGATGVSSPDQALAALRDQPDAQKLHRVLSYLKVTARNLGDFNIRVPGPLSAQIISTLVNDTIPNYWDVWPATFSSEDDKGILIECLKSVSGLGAIVARLKGLVQDFHQKQRQSGGNSDSAEQQIKVLSDTLANLLQESVILDLWRVIQDFTNAPTQRQILWRELVSLLAAGRIVSVAAQATDLLKSTTSAQSDPWYASGSNFALWIGRSTALFVSNATDSTGSDGALLLGKSLTLGYPDNVLWEFLSRFPLHDATKLPLLQQTIRKLRAHEQRQVLFTLLNVLSSKLLAVRDENLKETSRAISASVAFLQAVTNSNDTLKESLTQWLTNPTGGCANVSFGARRVAVAALQSDEDRMCKVLERSMEQFGDELFIRHTPILQQEALAQILLMSSGYIHRMQPMLLFTLARSSVQMRGTSNRLGSSSLRARFLGMIVAAAISELVDKPETQLNFGIPDTESEEAGWFKQLPQLNDSIGSVEDFEQVVAERTTPITKHSRPQLQEKKKAGHSSEKPKKGHAAAGPKIIEIMSDSDEDEDLVPYAKPDSDPEDDSEDPTQVTRNRPTAPVYIRDLLAGLRESEDYDRHQLALSTAANLIRRKTGFGKEVKDNLEELASVLIGLNDQFDLENFQDMRQQALIAVAVAEPTQMGPYLVRCFYAGDYSISQRTSILAAIGLGAREMAGFKESVDESDSRPRVDQSFPSKMLPGKLHSIYSTEGNAVDAITNKLKHTMISPLALDAADKAAGPNALKVRTFSSRMEVEKKRRIITNELAKVVAQSFFFPLTAGWWTHSRALGTSNIYYSATILPLFLKTLAILLHSSGSSTLSLPQMTSELWDLLLAVRAPALSDSAILEGVLFALLMLLEVNENQQRLVHENGRELLETQEWAKMVFDRTGGGSGEEERVRTLAAGVLVKCGEVVEKYQGSLMGDMMDF
ncbi:telomere length regulation protein [Diplodia corticola]|uniref:Telomere length regulation protein n=1 Tax=Diplodia corticola TaxID=236234 RepID=A0A1J9RPE1_9PEZI|nr:telomere length regulation protein [Diplodia corticola]OJD29437.1 telomere length regulation protein [Diplodia corticola]